MSQALYEPKSKDVFLLGVVGGDLGGAVDEVDGGFAPPRFLGLAAVGLLVLVEEQLAALQDHTDPVPGPRGGGSCEGVRGTSNQVAGLGLWWRFRLRKTYTADKLKLLRPTEPVSFGARVTKS